MKTRNMLLALGLLLTGFIAGNLAPVSAQGAYRQSWDLSDVRYVVSSLKDVATSLKSIDKTLRDIARKK